MKTTSPSKKLRLLTYNIQMGIETRHYGDYVTRSWRHFVHHQKRFENIDRVAALIKEYDLVAIQEADGGSLRSGFINIIEYLAEKSRFPYWYSQCNRNLGRIAQHSNGVLSRYCVNMVVCHRLPGFIPGRGAMQVFLGDPKNPLVIFVVHLALGQRTRKKQLQYIGQLCKNYKHIIVMGDMNCSADQVLYTLDGEGVELDSHQEPIKGTFPSWAPRRQLDHILISPTMRIKAVNIHDDEPSDHLPVAMEIELPPELIHAVNPPKEQQSGQQFC